MSSALKRFRTGIFSVGAFALGIATERHFHLYADAPDQLTLSGDTVDGLVPTKSGVSGLSGGYTARIARHGFPSSDSLRSYPNFVVSYDRRNRISNWVMEHLTRDNLKSDSYDRKGIEFFEDMSFHHFFRATNLDFKGSGYDRGHLAASGNYRSNPDHIKETFVLSNIAPQVGKGFNRDKWNELEKYCRKKVNEVGQAWICTGPLFLPQRDLSSGKLMVKYEVIGRNHVSVPTHFFKILLYESHGSYFMESYMLPNTVIPNDKPLNMFRVDPEVIERSAGIILFNRLPRNQIKLVK